MNKVAILTDFAADDIAYSIRRVASAQARMLYQAGIAYKLFVRSGFNPQKEDWPRAEFVYLDPGQIGNNVVEVTARSGQDILFLEQQMREALSDCSVVLAHDLNFAANLWKYYIAACHIAKDRNDLHWYLWVHSGGGPVRGAGKFADELGKRVPNSTLVVLHNEELVRKCELFGYEIFQTANVPNPIDFAESYHPAAVEMIERNNLWDADVIAVYPCRLDRGKQPHIVLEVFAELADLGWDARVIIIDFHSTGGDKAKYREEMRTIAKGRRLPVYFSSDLEYSGAEYQIPHKAVMDLLDFSDILLDPSMSESDPLIVLEAAWARCGLILNFDHTVFRLWQGQSLQYKFSSNVNVTDGMPGPTTTTYNDRRAYMKMVAGGIAYLMRNNPLLDLHVTMRQTRSLRAVWKDALGPLVMKHGPYIRTRKEEKAPQGKVSIIVPCWLIPDAGDYGDDELFMFTEKCVKSIREYMPDAELILVDNGSIVHADWLKENADIYIRNEENWGYAPAANQGLIAATGEWLMVVNNDVEFLDDWASMAIAAHDAKTGIVCSHMLAHDPQRRVGRELPPDQVGYFNGSCWLLNRAVYDDVGGLDTEYKFGMYDDKDLIQRITRTGRQAIKIGHINHIGNATWGKLPGQELYYAANKERYEKLWGK